MLKYKPDQAPVQGHFDSLLWHQRLPCH